MGKDPLALLPLTSAVKINTLTEPTEIFALKPQVKLRDPLTKHFVSSS